MIYRKILVFGAASFLFAACATNQKRANSSHDNKALRHQFTIPVSDRPVTSDQARIVYQSPRIRHQNPAIWQVNGIDANIMSEYQEVVAQPNFWQKPYGVNTSETTPQITKVDAGVSLSRSQPMISVIPSKSLMLPEYSKQHYERAGHNTHLIKAGNTVYSIARGLCVRVNEIKLLNGLNNDYDIRVGERLYLPASRC